MDKHYTVYILDCIYSIQSQTLRLGCGSDEGDLRSPLGGLEAVQIQITLELA